MKTILVPTDFSKEAKHALDVATLLASKTGAEITLLHIVEGIQEHDASISGETLHQGNTDDLFILKLLEKSKKDLHKVGQEISSKGVKVHTALKVGSVYKHIAAHIAAEKIDLIVMGTQGATGLTELLVGSNTEKVVKLANAPVLSVRADSNATAFQNLVLASTFEAIPAAALDIIKSIQTTFGSKIHVVYVNTPSLFMGTIDSKKKLDEFVSTNGLKNTEIHIFNDSDEENGIAHFAAHVNADLIMMGTHHRRGLMRVLYPSITAHMVNHSPVPVLTFSI